MKKLLQRLKTTVVKALRLLYKIADKAVFSPIGKVCDLLAGVSPMLFGNLKPGLIGCGIGLLSMGMCLSIVGLVQGQITLLAAMTLTVLGPVLVTMAFVANPILIVQLLMAIVIMSSVLGVLEYVARSTMETLGIPEDMKDTVRNVSIRNGRSVITLKNGDTVDPVTGEVFEDEDTAY